VGICVINRAGAGEGEETIRTACSVSQERGSQQRAWHGSAVHTRQQATAARFTVERCSQQRSWLQRGSQQCVVLDSV